MVGMKEVGGADPSLWNHVRQTTTKAKPEFAPQAAFITTDLHQTGSYANFQSHKPDLSFPLLPTTPLNVSIAWNYLTTNTTVSPLDQPTMDALAQELGIPDFDALKHLLRHVPATAMDTIKTELQAVVKNKPSQSVLRQSFSRAVHEAVAPLITALFETHQSPLPQLMVGDSKTVFDPHNKAHLDIWNAAAMLGVYNGFVAIATTSPTAFKKMAENQGEAPLLIRRTRDLPAMGDTLMEQFSQVMRISEQPGREIVIRDSAIKQDSAKIVGALHSRLTHLEEALKQPNTKEGQAALKEIQAFLNFSRPAKHPLKLTGNPQKDLAAVRKGIQQFILTQRLTAFQETLADDGQLKAKYQQKWQKKADQFYEKIFTLAPDEAQYKLKQLLISFLNDYGNPQGLSSDKNHLSGTTDQRLNELYKQWPNDELPDHFDANSLTGMVDNWFNIMDSGQSDFTEQVLIHEAGHTLQDEPDVLLYWDTVSNTASSAPSMAATLQHHHSNNCCLRGDSSAYGRTNNAEDFAESFRTFTVQPERLMQASLLKFLYINAVTKRFDANEILKMAHENGLSDASLRLALTKFRGHLPARMGEFLDKLGDKMKTRFQQAASGQQQIQKLVAALEQLPSSFLQTDLTKLNQLVPQIKANGQKLIARYKKVEQLIQKIDQHPENIPKYVKAFKNELYEINKLEKKLQKQLKQIDKLEKQYKANINEQFQSPSVFGDPKQSLETLANIPRVIAEAAHLFGTLGQIKTPLAEASQNFRNLGSWMSGLTDQMYAALKEYETSSKPMDPQFAATLAELDPLLGLTFTDSLVSTEDPGTVVQKFAEQYATAIQQKVKNTTQKTMRLFIIKGLDAFSEPLKLSPAIKKQLDGPANQGTRAVFMTLALIQGTIKASGNPTEFLKQLRQNPQAVIEQTLGPDIYALLPISFQGMLDDDAYIQNITGDGGKTTIHVNNLLEPTLENIEKWQAEGQLESLTLDLTTGLFPNIRNTPLQDLESQYEDYHKIVTRYNRANRPTVPLLSRDAFVQALSPFNRSAGPFDALEQSAQTSTINWPERTLIQQLKLNALFPDGAGLGA